MSLDLARIVRVLETVAGAAVMDEYDLQRELHDALSLAGIEATRERHLTGDGCRADIAIQDPDLPDGARRSLVVVEVKVDGSFADVERQLARYAACSEVAAIILATTRSKHHGIPFELYGKPTRLVSLITAGL